MFENIGEKIKTLATVISILGIGISCICGLVLIGQKFVAGILVAGIGSLISWISSFALYGFGELIETNHEINDAMKTLTSQQTMTNNQSSQISEQMSETEKSAE